jgi:hypothetical protein
LTDSRTYETPERMARAKLYPERITLPLTTAMLKRIDAAKLDGEDRVSLIREALERDLKRRERNKS